jgi:environmental stress-induced protein Ves
VALILRAADRAAVPWKNGGGLTREVAVQPPGSDFASFDWRVSLAEVRQGGPFSVFPQIDRLMAVIGGRLELTIAGGAPVTLSAESPPCEFAGDVPAYAEPLETPVSDLNVMTRRGRCAAQLRRCRAATSLVLPLEADATLLLALAPLSVHAASIAASLAPLDGVRFGAQPGGCVTAACAGAALDLWLIEIHSHL